MTKCGTQSLAELCVNRCINLMSLKVIKVPDVLNVQSTLNFVPLLQFDKYFYQLARHLVLEGVLSRQDSEESHTRKFLPDHTFMALTTPYLPGYSSLTIPSGHLPLFFSSHLIITTSPTAKVHYFPECFRLCFSIRLGRYSFDHLFHTVYG